MKKCNKCNTDKPLEDFNKESRNPDGRNYVCRECYKEYSKPKKARTKRRMNERVAPDLDKIMHCCYVRATDELNKLNLADKLTGPDVVKMTRLIDIVFEIKKKSRPVYQEDEDVSSNDEEDLFA